jgi:transposase InsO family protein
VENHISQLLSVDFFTVPGIRFQVLYVFLVLAHDRRRILHFNVTAHPTADSTCQQLRNAFPFQQFPRYLLRDRDAIFGQVFREQVRAIGIEEVLSTPRSPWQRAYVERITGLCFLSDEMATALREITGSAMASMDAPHVYLPYSSLEWLVFSEAKASAASA